MSHVHVARIASLAFVALPLTAQETVTLDGPVELAWKSRADAGGVAADSFSAIVARAGITYSAGYSIGLAGGTRVLVSARDAASGALVWERAVDTQSGFATLPDPVAEALSPDGSVLYVAHFAGGTASQGFAPRGAVTSLDAASGAVLATWRTASTWTLFESLAVSPDGARVFAAGVSDVFGPGGKLGVACFDTASGTESWSQFDQGWPSTPLGTMRVVADAAAPRVYVGRPGDVRALDAVSGAPLWFADGSAVLAASAPFSRIYTVRQNTVVALDAASGVLLATAPPDILVGPQLQLEIGASGSIYEHGNSILGPRVRSYDAALQLRWAQDNFGPFATQPTGMTVAADESIYASYRPLSSSPNTSLSVRKIDPLTGTSVWTTTQPLAQPSTLQPLVQPTGTARVCVAGSRDALQAATNAVRVDFDAGSGAFVAASDSALTGSAFQYTHDAALSTDGSRLYTAGSVVSGLLQANVRGISTLDGTSTWSRDFDGVAFDSGFGASAERFLAAGPDRVVAQLGALPLNDSVFAEVALEALDAATGATLWHVSSPPALALSTDVALAGQGLVVVSSSIEPSQQRLELRGRALLNGALLWTQLDASASSAYMLRPRLAALPGGDFVVAFTLAGTPLLAAVQRRSAQTGAIVWSTTLPLAAGELSHVLANVATSTDGARIFVAGQVGQFAPAPTLDRTVALDASTGLGLWQTDLPTNLGLPAHLSASPNDRYVAIGRGGIGAAAWRATVLETANGQPLWNADLVAVGGQALSGSLGRLRFDATSSKLYALGALDPLSSGCSDLALSAHAVTDGAGLWVASYSTGCEGPAAAAGLELAASGTRAYAIGGTWLPDTGNDVVALALELPALVAHPASISLAAGGVQTFDLAPGAAHALDYAWLIGSASGTAPGFAVGNLLVPLNPDAYLQFTLANPNSGVLPDSLGALNAAAQRTAHFAIPAASDPALAGLVGHHAFAVIDATTFVPELVSNAVAVSLVP